MHQLSDSPVAETSLRGKRFVGFWTIKQVGVLTIVPMFLVRFVAKLKNVAQDYKQNQIAALHVVFHTKRTSIHVGWVSKYHEEMKIVGVHQVQSVFLVYKLFLRISVGSIQFNANISSTVCSFLSETTILLCFILLLDTHIRFLLVSDTAMYMHWVGGRRCTMNYTVGKMHLDTRTYVENI